ncbi:MAG: hypothetical protein R6U98_19675, partial [Pirellulaceae bacterium]
LAPAGRPLRNECVTSDSLAWSWLIPGAVAHGVNTRRGNWGASLEKEARKPGFLDLCAIRKTNQSTFFRRYTGRG